MSGDPAMSNLFFEETNHGDRDITRPRFYMRPVLQELKSAQAGRPIYEDREYVEITVPGNRGSVHDTPVKEEHRRRWPALYRAFKDGQDLPSEGTPLAEWPAVTRSQVEEMAHFHVRTVEQLASLPDDALQRVVAMGGYALREKAQRFLDQAAGLAPMEALAAKAERDDAKMASMEEQIRELKALLERGSGGAQ